MMDSVGIWTPQHKPIASFVIEAVKDETTTKSLHNILIEECEKNTGERRK